jgi:predicted DNA-binding transcriptional regulator YafY
LKNTVTDTTIDIQLKVKQNKELEMLILSYGNAIEVIEPMSLRNKIKDIISGLYSKYLV